MKPDPTVDRIRQIRHEISVKFGHDPRRLVEYYMEQQKDIPADRFFKSPSARQEVASNTATENNI